LVLNEQKFEYNFFIELYSNFCSMNMVVVIK